MKEIMDTVLASMIRGKLIQIEVSARHVHLSQRDFEHLFGVGKAMTFQRPLSQPGQFLAEERVTLLGPRGQLERTAILGPARKCTQIELAYSDCRKLGIHAPLRESGDTMGSGGLQLQAAGGQIDVAEGAIIARNHIHLTPEGADCFGLVDKQRVDVQALSERLMTFQNVTVRVNPAFKNRMHIDMDEANAAGISGFTLGRILG
ncbi:phosphate propanoyltransferase [Eubacterium barkeri]|uniref:Phosphate propanoyltransferase n=1 Tax=Eubacterium barkeri TaxID=1528 RepID=A0A1H3I1A1_EUBBA|nr:phosphate propanoyltransferase [Eubacterium barkeri]SDY20858.1 putative phosphotransacetylase [Eubacterium barkeri]